MSGTAPVVVVTTPPVHGGVKRKPVRVRRSDFSSEENYRLALKAALAGAYTIADPAEAPIAKAVKVKTVNVPTVKTQIDDPALIQAFITAIESEYE